MWFRSKYFEWFLQKLKQCYQGLSWPFFKSNDLPLQGQRDHVCAFLYNLCQKIMISLLTNEEFIDSSFTCVGANRYFSYFMFEGVSITN